jgi:hypothetical protein
MSLRRFLIASMSTLLLAAPSTARAQFISCGSYSECERAYANQRARAIENEMMLKEMQKTGEQRAQARAMIKQAREQFWTTYPDKPGAEKARKEFSYWLAVKDIYYLREHLKAPVMKDEHGRRTATAGANFLDTFGGFDEKIDDGIRSSALHEFEDWAMAVRDKLFEGHTSNSTDDAFMQGLLATWMGQKFWDAVAANMAGYEAYVTLRDWWEFDHVNRMPAGFDTPATYGVYLYARFRKVPLPAATSNYKKMTELLGIERVQAAAKRVMEAPKAEDGALVVTADPYKKGPGGGEMIDYDKPMPEGVIGVYADPARAMELLATQDDDRRYLLYLLHNHAPDLRRLDPATTWTFADTAYRRLVLAFGEPAVLQAARAVRLAPKRMYSGGVMTVKELDVKRTEPVETFQDLLAQKDGRGYVRAALIFAKDLETTTAVDSAYRTYAEAKGEQAVLDAAHRRALNKPQLTYKGELQFLDAEIATPTVERPQAPQKDSPQYLTWKRFGPGANAVYIDRILSQQPLQRDLTGGAVNARSRYLLRSIDADRANLYQTIIAYDNPSPRTPMVSGAAHPPRDTEIAYPALIDAAQSVRTQAAAGTSLQSGDETLEIRSMRIATHWEAVQVGVNQPNCGPTIVTTWTSDDVPGGLVRKTVDKACSYGRSVRETLLESFTASGSPDAVKPIQPVIEIAAILPLRVPSTVPGQDAQKSASTTEPVTPPPLPVRPTFDPNMRASAPPPSPPPASGAAEAQVPQGTLLTVMVSGPINSATNHAGDNFRGTIVQPVVVNGAPLLPYGTQVTMQLAQVSDVLGIILTGIVRNGRTLAANSTPAALDAQTASRNAAMEQAIASAGPRADRLRSRLETREVVVTGSRVNVPSGTRLIFTLSDPFTISPQ